MRPQGRIALSAIQYRTDLVVPDGPKILLGFLVEVQAPHGRLLGMLARKSLTPKEKAQLDGIARVQLENPSKYLERECGKAFASASDDVLDYLTKQHVWALMVTEPYRRNLPANLARLKRPEALIKHTQQWLLNEVPKAQREFEQQQTPRVAKRTSHVKSRKPESVVKRKGYSYSVTLQGAALHV